MMKAIPRLRACLTLTAALLGCGFGLAPRLWAAVAVPPEIRQDLTPYNAQWVLGAPTATGNESGSANLPSTNQFRTLTTFGATTGLTRTDMDQLGDHSGLQNGTGAFNGTKARNMRLPIAKNSGAGWNNALIVQRRALIGAPYLARAFTYQFGSVISPPATDEHGRLLTVDPSTYWQPRPYAPQGVSDVGLGYYWSPNARQVYAIQAGPISVTWVRTDTVTAADDGYTNLQGPGVAYTTADGQGATTNMPSTYQDGDSYLLYTQRYLVSSSPIKPPQKIYWTEGSFVQKGQLVSVPTTSVGVFKFVYNSRFPEEVASPYDADNTGPNARKTIYFQGQGFLGNIHAYNIDGGRIFLELLGEAREDGTHVPFGFEIVDVYKQPVPTDITVNLGDRIPAYQDGTAEQEQGLTPAPVIGTPQKYYYEHPGSGGDVPTLYATHATANPNDFQAYWLITGVAGLKWPYLFNRYREVWPSDPSKYVHYLRPEVASEDGARQTAVQLPGTEAPQAPYQDPLPSPFGARLLQDGRFYTYLNSAYPAHRSLLQFISGDHVAFERVFSWLDSGIRDNAEAAASGTPNPSSAFRNSVATNLVAWNNATSTLHFTNELSHPRYVTNTVFVGNRINPPADELGGIGAYWAGYIQQASGNAFHPRAYLDPFALGFDAANLGAIIPVNAAPDNNVLEVWWFRRNAADASQGFKPVYWPSVIGHYDVRWPAPDPNSEIILARNDGTGPLDSLQAQGTVYRQNDLSLPGYNPNEEHGLMLGGQGYALRDDLNVTRGRGYTSEPFVLLDYTGADGRPNMRLFHVQREKPEAGLVFDYVVEAGKILQGPMPLPLLELPIDENGVNANSEPPATSQDRPTDWESLPAKDQAPYSHYVRFTYEDRKRNFWVYRGQHAGPPPLQAGAYQAGVWSSGSPDAPLTTHAQLDTTFSYHIDVSQPVASLWVSAKNLPPGLTLDTDSASTSNGLAISGTPTRNAANDVVVTLTHPTEGSSCQVYLRITVNNQPADTTRKTHPRWNYDQGFLPGFPGRTRSVFLADRSPLFAAKPTAENSFSMQYYYKNQAAFDWPGEVVPAGGIVPYLRAVNANGEFVGDPTSGDTPSLDIVYRPVWPSLVHGEPLPSLYTGETLTVPKRGMAAVRGQSSALVLYQQSIARNITQAEAGASVTLFDPTVQKTSSLTGMGGLPASIVSRSYLGKVYFPDLPPHLKKRVFFDPNTTNLVLQGQFVDEPVGEKYLLLNVLKGADLQRVKDLCPSDADERSDWERAVNRLSVTVYTRQLANGQYQVDTEQNATRSANDLVTITNSNTAVDSYALTATGPGIGYLTYLVGNGEDPAHAGEPVSMYVIRTVPELYPGAVKVITDENPLSENITFQHTSDLAGEARNYEYDWRLQPPVDGQPDSSPREGWTPLVDVQKDLANYTLGGSVGIRVLGDNYVSVRYRSTHPSANAASKEWSAWTEPQLTEGWIKRVLAGINPFNQRTKDLFNNPANTTASIIAQAGHRWEGDVALNLDALNGAGLIEIYETVLNRGKNLSIDAAVPINYGPANDALLLAAGYLNDLYMLLGNDAWADAANPTIGIGTADRTYGNIATALFAFKGQEPSLLEEELALLRGRDDIGVPGVQLNPVYNRLYWNYTRGIDAGEVIYALNYNILDQNNNGVVDAADAAVLFPQGHGDAYGHYLTALGGYYTLLMNPAFSWVPRIEAVTVLGAAVSVDYQDERKFAAAATARARAGRQVFDLTWRQDYRAGTASGWDAFGGTRANPQHTFEGPGGTAQVTRYWGADHWATRAAQGAYLDWVVGNAILPPVDPDPNHEGIQKVDRTTVPELRELPSIVSQLQTDLSNAEGGATPVGLSPHSIPFDIDPLLVTGANPQTHFEQIYQRAVNTLNNAVVAFDDAQGVTQLLRSEGDSLAAYQAAYTNQETAYITRLIELYGTPYPDDIGPGKTYLQGYAGPDLFHYTYVENPDGNFTEVVPDPSTTFEARIDIQNLATSWYEDMTTTLEELGITPSTDPGWDNNKEGLSVQFNVGPNGFFDKPPTWTSSRESPGKIQQAISVLIATQNKLRKAVAFSTYDKQALDKAMMAFTNTLEFSKRSADFQIAALGLEDGINAIQAANAIASKIWDNVIGGSDDLIDTLSGSIPTDNIFGTATGGDQSKVSLSLMFATAVGAKEAARKSQLIALAASSVATAAIQTTISGLQGATITSELTHDLQNRLMEVGNMVLNIQGDLFTINEAARELEDAQRAYKAMQAEGNRILQERLTFRQRASAILQGYRTRDAAFRIFLNEKLERYKTLFDLASQYSFLAAQAYDYETGLLNTPRGQVFLNRILSARALGIVKNGQPQYAGSNTGDPGLSSALAEMKADWDVLRGRLGFNNPVGYGTTVSLRTENYRILSTRDGDANWQDLLQQGRMADLRADPDVKRYCMQIDGGAGLPVPGFVLSFSTVIADGQNLFGKPLAPGDHALSPSAFATKIFSLGVSLEGYIGMDDPTPGGNAGGVSPTDPTLDPHALAANPHVYLIPVGADSMRSPPLGDVSAVRTWKVDDLTIPLPFNISAADFSNTAFYQSNDSLTEPLFSVRKHAAFRPVSTAAAFNTAIYSGSGALQASEYTNRRLIGRSVWNSQWKLVIPGKTLLHDPDQGLDRFIQSVKDIKLRFITYSYAGN